MLSSRHLSNFTRDSFGLISSYCVPMHVREHAKYRIRSINNDAVGNILRGVAGNLDYQNEVIYIYLVNIDAFSRPNHTRIPRGHTCAVLVRDSCAGEQARRRLTL